MSNYDNFNPTIPDTEEIVRQEPLPPLPPDNEQPEKRVERKSRKTGSRSAAKKQPKKKEKKPFVQSVKDWASSQTTRWITGLALGFFGVYLGVSFLSYFVTCVIDQSEIANSPVGHAGQIANSGGEGGARISEFLINECFGLGSFVIIFWL